MIIYYLLIFLFFHIFLLLFFHILCLWDDNTILIGCQDKEIKIFDLQNNKIIKALIGHNNSVITLKKINHINFGECLITHGFEKDQIKIWSFSV